MLKIVPAIDAEITEFKELHAKSEKQIDEIT